MLVVLAIILAIYTAKKFIVKKSKVLLASMMTVGLLLIGLIVLTNNPIKKRYQEIMDDNLDIVTQKSYSRDIPFNGLNLRLIIWRFGYEILNELRVGLFRVVRRQPGPVEPEVCGYEHVYRHRQGRQGLPGL